MIGNIPPSTTRLDQASDTLATAQKRLSSGLRINTAKDDAAGLAIATRLAVQLGADDQALRNVNDGLSVAGTAGGALGQASDVLQRMRELAVQAANGTNSPSDRQALGAEFSQLAQNLDALSQTQFNGQKLLDGSFSAPLQTGPDVGDTQPLALGDVSAHGLGLGGLDLISAQSAAGALGAIDKAISSVGAQQATVGAAQASLSSAAATLAGAYENLAAAKSRIADTDYAAESASQGQAGIRQQAAMKALSLYNANQAAALPLINATKP